MEKIQPKLVFEPLMFRNSLMLLVLFVCFYNPVRSQISITEVYYNTPFNEMLMVNNAKTLNTYNTKRHHLGEFIELCNYSDKDINLSNWFISYKGNKLYLPDKIIKSGQLMVVTYQSLWPYTDFFNFFQLNGNSMYSPDQVIYHSSFMLRNKSGGVYLGQRLHNTSCERLVSNLSDNIYSWDFINEPPKNFVNDIAKNLQEFYEVSSLQYNPSNISPISDRPTPLSLPSLVNIPTQSYDDLVKGFYQANYAYLTYYENIANILNSSCSINIPACSQIPANYSQLSTPTKLCFNYDNAGDGTGVTINCTSGTTPNPTTTFTPDVLQDISNDITVYPNPTYISKVYVAWKGKAIGKISSVKISDFLGNTIFPLTPTTNLSIPFTCPLLSSTAISYTALFTLTTGQTITKYILKF